MSVTWAWAGAVTPSGFAVKAKITGTEARLAVSTTADLSNPTYFGPAPPTNSVVSLAATGLAAGARHYWAVEDTGVLDTTWKGHTKTHPPTGQPGSFTFAVGSCAGLTGSDPGGNDHIATAVSNRPVFDDIRALLPDFFVYQGDLHYRNIATADIALYRQAYTDVLTFNGTLGAAARQGQLYREVPIAYQWDDHCYGPNNSDGTFVGKTQAAQAYRENVPHYPLGQPDEDQGIYHAFQVGRVLCVLWDERYYRDPNANPDGPTHTMLGAAQKAWLTNLLANSTAEFLCVFSQVDWLRETGDDNWNGFAAERDEVAQIFADTGWLDRMCMFIGDRHTMGMCSGATNAWGGFPVYMYGSLDSNPGVSVDTRYDLGITGGRDRFGLVSVDDQGDQIVITNSGYINGSVWNTHSITVVLDIPPPPDPPPPVGIAKPRTSVTWLSCDAATGTIIAELPDILSPVSRVLGAYTSSSAALPIPISGPGRIPIGVVEAATDPARVMLVPVVNDLPIYGGIILPQEGGTDPSMQLGLVSLEGYLDRRMVRDHTWTQRDEASVIVAGLVGDAEDIDGVGRGLGLIIDAPETGTLRDREYKATDRKSVYEALQELMTVEDGPEWTIDLDWTDVTQSAIAKIFRVRKRIGLAAASPAAVFETTASSVFSSQGSSEATYTYTVDKSAERYANYVIAYSSGEGEDQPQSDPAIDLDALNAGAPIYERHYQPSTSISDKATLDAHAAAELVRRKNGSRVFTIEARWDAYPKYGIDWQIGDDVAWNLVGHRHPQGIAGQGRVIGFQLDMQAGLIRPTLKQDDDAEG